MKRAQQASPFWAFLGSPVTTLTLIGGLTLFACSFSSDTTPSSPSKPSSVAARAEGQIGPLADPGGGLAVATFAGGCFWCMEPPFEKLDGVKSVVSGYTGGPEERPTYQQVGRGRTKHLESVRVVYDPDFITYKELLETFWMSIDPTDDGGQFADRGHHYTTAVFFHDDHQKETAEASKKALDESKKFGRPIVTDIRPAMAFWEAESYHQNYYKTNPVHYNRYRRGSGRAGFLERHWGKKK